MKKQREILRRIEALPEPRHLFVLPEWADAGTLDALVRDGYLSSEYQQRSDKGAVIVAMGLQITPKGDRLLHPEPHVKKLFVRGSLAGASFAAMSLLILYLA